MVAPQLDTEHPGIRVIAEVASVLQAGSASGVALRGVVGALRRGLNLRRCRLWLRTPDGSRYAPVTTPGDDADLPGYSPPVADWVRQNTRPDAAMLWASLLTSVYLGQRQSTSSPRLRWLKTIRWLR